MLYAVPVCAVSILNQSKSLMQVCPHALRCPPISAVIGLLFASELETTVSGFETCLCCVHLESVQEPHAGVPPCSTVCLSVLSPS
jgi:hypothetical protein